MNQADLDRIKLLQPGDVLLIRYLPPWVIGWLIQTISRDVWSHAALYVGNGNVIEAKGGGVKRNTLEKVLKWTKWRADRYPYLALNNDKKNNLLAWAFSRIGWGYDFSSVGYILVLYLLDWLGIVKNIKNYSNPFNRKNSFYCSEFVVEAYRSQGINLFPGGDINPELAT